MVARKPLATYWGQNEKETATYANGEARDSSEATAVTPTLTRRNGGNVSVSNERIAHKDRIVNPYDTLSESDIISLPAKKHRKDIL